MHLTLKVSYKERSKVSYFQEYSYYMIQFQFSVLSMMIVVDAITNKLQYVASY